MKRPTWTDVFTGQQSEPAYKFYVSEEIRDLYVSHGYDPDLFVVCPKLPEEDEDPM